jgi:hypothetical protein
MYISVYLRIEFLFLPELRNEVKKNDSSSKEKSKEKQGNQKFNESERRVIFIGI